MPALLLSALFLAQAGDLDSKDQAVARKAFEEAIKAADEKALETAATTSSPARLALAEVRAHKRFGEHYPPLPVVSFEAKDRPTKDVIAALSKAIGVEIVEYGRFGPARLPATVSLRVADAGPLEAFDALCAAAGLSGRIDGKRFLYGSGSERSPAGVWYWRHFAFAVRNYRERRTVDPLGGTIESASIEVVVYHGALGRIGVHGDPVALEIVDEKGDSLAGARAERAPFGLFSDWASHSTFQVPIRKPENGRTTVAMVRGLLPVMIPEKMAWKEIPLDAGRRELVLERLAVRVDGMEPSGARARLLTWIPDYGKPFVLPKPEDVELVGKDGARVAATGTRQWFGRYLALDLTFRPPDGFSPTAIRIAYAESLGEHQIPFEFRNVRIR